MATKQDPFSDATLIASQTGSEVEGGLLLNTNQTGEAYLDFSGSSQYIDMGDQNDFTFGNGSTDSAFSGSVWVNMDDATNFYIFVKDDFSTSSNREWNLNVGATDLFRLSLIDQSTGGSIARVYNTALTSYQGKWIHLAFTYSGTSTSSGIRLYLNGVRVDDTDGSSGSYTAMENKTSTFKIGARPESSNYANGQMRDARLFSSELTADQIRSLYLTGTNPATPLGWWKMDDGSGTTVTDSGSGSHNGDLTSHAATWVSAPSEYAIRSETTSTDLLSGLGATAVSTFKYTTAKKPGGTQARLQFSSDGSAWKNANGDSAVNAGGYVFDGVDDVITVAKTIDDLMSNATGTMSLWVRPDGPGVSTAAGEPWKIDGVITDSGAFLGIHWGTTSDGTGFHFYNFDGTADRVLYPVTSADYGRWFHLTWVHSGGTLYAYVDGVLVGSTTSGNTSTVTGTFRIGANWVNVNGNDFFPGAIDDVRVYEIALTATEIWDLYSRGKESYNSSTGLELWLKLDGNANDSSGNGYNGSVSGATSFTGWYDLPALGEGAVEDVDTLKFDGVNDTATSATTPITAYPFTIYAWFKVEKDQQGIIFEMADSATDAERWTLYVDSVAGGQDINFASVHSSVFSTATSSVKWQLNQWHFAAVTAASATDRKLYVDGVQVGANTTSSTPTSIDKIGIGLSPRLSGGAPFKGLIANAALYSDVRTAAEILTDFNNGYIDTSNANLVASWSLADATSPTDDPVGGYDLTVSGATWTKSSTRPIPAVGSQQTIDISGLGFTSAFYVREYMHNYTPGQIMRTYAFNEISVDYTGSAAQLATTARSFGYIF